MTTTNTCQFCRHWKQIPAKLSTLTACIGECHANPPTGPQLDGWPKTTADQNCGSYEAQPGPPKTTKAGPKDRQLGQLTLGQKPQPASP